MVDSEYSEESDWFAEWFDSPYYHLLYDHRDELEAQGFLDRLINHFQWKQGTRMMDLACGKGRHAIHLNQRGMLVTGLDLSKNSIDSVRHLNSDSLHFQVWDMREPYGEGGYEVILNLFTSFGYFQDLSDNVKALKAMRSVLADGGVIVMDYLNVIPVLDTLPSDGRIQKGKVQFQTRKFLEDGSIKKHIRIEDDAFKGEYTESVQALMLEDFKGLFDRAGLTLTEVFGDYSLKSFKEESSPRLIMVLETI